MTAPDLDARLGAVIRQRRILLGLSQEALGKRLGITFQQLQKYEKGTNQVSFARLVKLAKALGTSVADLVGAALGEDAACQESLSDRETLELVKRLALLTPNQRRGVKLLVQSLTAEERPPGWSPQMHGVGPAKPREPGVHAAVVTYPATNDQREG